MSTRPVTTVVKGRVSRDGDLVVPKCPACKAKHVHGFVSDEVHLLFDAEGRPYLRGYAHRLPHCSNDVAGAFHQIIEFDVTPKQAQRRQEAEKRSR